MRAPADIPIQEESERIYLRFNLFSLRELLRCYSNLEYNLSISNLLIFIIYHYIILIYVLKIN